MMAFLEPDGGKAEIIQRTVTITKTIQPPTRASGPGTSPMRRKTQNGFNIGSMPEIRTDSSAVTCFMALE